MTINEMISRRLRLIAERRVLTNSGKISSAQVRSYDRQINTLTDELDKRRA